MTSRAARFAALLIVAGLLSPAYSQTTKYWVGSDPDPTPNGTWDTVSPLWSANADGSGGPVTWADFDFAVFSAGTGATGAYTVTLDGFQSTSGITFANGTATIDGGDQLSLEGFPTTTIEAMSGAAGVIGSSLGGFSTLNKTGPGNLTLRGDNSNFFGEIEVHSGILVANLGTTAAPNPFVLGDDFSITTVFDGGSLQVTGSGGGSDEPITISGHGSTGTNGALRKTGGGTTTVRGGVTLAAPSRIVGANGTLSIANNALVIGSHDLTFGGTNTITIANVQIEGDGNITKEGTGQLNVGTSTSFQNGFTGKWFINEGTVQIPGNENNFAYSLGAPPAAFIPDAVTLNGGTLRSTNAAQGGNFIHPLRGIQLGPNGGSVGVTGTNALIYHSNPDQTGGRITLAPGTNEATLTKVGPGELRVQGGGTQHMGFTRLVVQEGLFRIGSVSGNNHETGFGAAPATFLPDAITLNGGAIGTSFSITLNANRGITLGPNGGGFTVAAAPMTVPGAITGVGALNKSTSGQLTIQGASDYSGGTNVSAGTLVVSTTNATLGTGDVTVTGGTLTISAGVLNAIADTATLSITGPGVVNLGAGINDIITGLLLDGIAQGPGSYGSSTHPTFFSGTGVVTLGVIGGLPGDHNDDGVVDAADYVLWRKDPAAHGGVPQGYNDWRANFGATSGTGAGNSLSTAAVPEPASIALLMLGLAALAVIRRRR